MRQENVQLTLPRFLPTQQAFRQQVHDGVPGDPEAIGIYGYFGGWGSGKTTIGKWIVFEAISRFPKLKVLVVRDTFASLNLTTKQEFLHRMVEGDSRGRNMADLLKDTWSEQLQTYTHRSGAQVTFGGLDKVEKWGSTEFGMIWIDEAGLIGEQDVPFLLSRLRQVAPKCPTCWGYAVGCRDCGETGNLWGPDFRRAMILTANHVYTEHFLYKWFVGTEEDPPRKNYLHVETSSWENSPEQGGHLPTGYLQSLQESGDPRMVSVYMGGSWGVVPSGTPVYTWIPSIEGKGWHERECKFDKNRPLYMSIDFGYRFPFITFHQVQRRGRWRVLGELTLQQSRTEELLYLAMDTIRSRWPNAHLHSVYGDPAGWQQRSEGGCDAETVKRVCKVPFLSVASTPATKEGRRMTLQQKLSQTSLDEPMFAVDPHHCPRLCEAFRGMYRYPEVKQRFAKENYVESPIEEHPFVDVMHSVEYFAANHFQGERTEAMLRKIGRPFVPKYNFQ